MELRLYDNITQWLVCGWSRFYLGFLKGPATAQACLFSKPQTPAHGSDVPDASPSRCLMFPTAYGLGPDSLMDILKPTEVGSMSLILSRRLPVHYSSLVCTVLRPPPH